MGDTERDIDYNPYSDAANGDPPRKADGSIDIPKGRVVFEETKHQYWLVDSKGMYTDNILSGSSVYEYLNHYRKFLREMERAPTLEESMKGYKGRMHFPPASVKKQALGFGEFIRNYMERFPVYFNNLRAEERPAKKPRVEQQVLTFQERCVFAKTVADKEFMYIWHSSTFEALERWVLCVECSLDEATDKINWPAIDKPQDLLLLRRALSTLASPLAPSFDLGEDEPPTHSDESLSLLEILNAQSDIAITPLTSDDLVQVYRQAADQGTALHAYMEGRLNGGTKEECAQQFPVHEPRDIDMAESFFEVYPPTTWFKAEQRVGSFTHKVAGSMDALERIDVDGKPMCKIHDWKRTSKPLADRSALRPVPGKTHLFIAHQPKQSSELWKYCIQFAVYRKLLMLRGAPVPDVASMTCLSPTQPSFAVIECHLNEKGSFDKHTGMLRPSPIEEVEEAFALRLAQLKEHYKC